MPQAIGGAVRTPHEAREFDLMLGSICDLYLTVRVLILLDNTYAGRFWTLMEAWCAMMTTTSDGVRQCRPGEERYTIACIHKCAAGSRPRDLWVALSLAAACWLGRSVSTTISTPWLNPGVARGVARTRDEKRGADARSCARAFESAAPTPSSTRRA
jgi:hypothetical protein